MNARNAKNGSVAGTWPLLAGTCIGTRSVSATRSFPQYVRPYGEVRRVTPVGGTRIGTHDWAATTRISRQATCFTPVS